MTTLPDFQNLTDTDKATVVFFLRTAQSEGLAYAEDNYPPNFEDGSPLADADAEEIDHAYAREYESLPLNEFWRLYEKAERAR